MTQELLIIFVRAAIKGKVKTRLAESVGDKRALSIYKKLIEHTHRITVGLTQKKWITYSENIEINDVWEKEKFENRSQTGKDLGQKMSNAFQYGFSESFEHICLIGSDIFELTEDILREAFHLLQHHDLVLGPAHDGGYYLIGMKKLHKSLFEDIQWSTNEVLGKTIKKAKKLNLEMALLPTLNDIDTLDDIKDVDRDFLLS